jgi:esterase/lipase superfamily enzyme
MFVITNRKVNENETGLDAFGKRPNPEGPKELRMVEVTGTGKGPYTVKVLKDQLTPAEVAQLIETYKLDIDPAKPWFASLQVACKVFARTQKKKKQLLLYVHGYNNDMQDVMKTANQLEKSYDVTVVPFSWPANGGGKVSGAAAYLSDKDDARVSATALHRAVEKVQFYHQLLTEKTRKDCLDEAHETYKDNREQAYAHYTELMEKQCNTTLNLLCHSMGNYVLKYASKPSNSSLRKLVFDNIGLVAADANNPGHEQWVQNLPSRNRLYVVINENDGALRWSRRKPGDEQKERLGHHLRNLNANNAYYVDVTRNRGVGSGHSYFKGETIKNNSTLKKVFRRVFEGGNAEQLLKYHADINVYRT